jgi:hypothetical protein
MLWQWSQDPVKGGRIAKAKTHQHFLIPIHPRKLSQVLVFLSLRVNPFLI